MNKNKLWISLLLMVIVLGLMALNMENVHDNSITKPLNSQIPTYQSEYPMTIVYNPIGQLSYKLMAKNVKYYTDSQQSWFSKPVMTLFDENAIATWKIQSDLAKLTNNRILYLYGHVEVKSLISTSQLKKIKTDSANINLITQDLVSDREMTIYGIDFISHCMKMRGNIRAKTAELIDQVKTNYERYNKKNST